jgi:hypothetical protein
MPTTHPHRHTQNPRQIDCVSTNRNVRQMAQSVAPGVDTAVVVPSEGIITVITPDEGTFAFVCGHDRAGWNLVMANVLVGLGFFRVTSLVPAHLIDPLKVNQSYVVEKADKVTPSTA